jgi:hypothetical protein
MPDQNPQWYQWANLSLGLLSGVLSMVERLVGHLGNQPDHVAQLQALKDAHADLAANTPQPPGA